MSYEYIYYIHVYVFRLGISSDFISGFCGETDTEHADNLSLIRTVGFDQAFTYRFDAIHIHLHIKKHISIRIDISSSLYVHVYIIV